MTKDQNAFARLNRKPDTSEARLTAEQRQKQIVDGRTLRRRNRAEQVAFKTTVEIKALLQELAQERGTTITEVLETAVLLLAKERRT
jgi:hypothetical protein